MPLRLPAGLFGFTLLLLIQSGVRAQAAELRSINDVPGIATYRAQARFSIGEAPPIQLTEVDGEYGKNPERHAIRITVTENGREPVSFATRQVDGQLYVNSGGRWAEAETFHHDELIVLSPEKLLGIGARLEELGAEELNGRKVRHLRGNRNDLLALAGDSDSSDIARLDQASLDLWVDERERFIVKLHVSGTVPTRGGVLPVDLRYEYTDINQPLTVERPPASEIAQVPLPPALSQDDVTRKLGFEFPLPESAHVSIYGATVSILTALPLAEARQYAERSLRAAGYVPSAAVERAPGEFYTDYVQDERTVGVLVFQVTERGATIQVGAPK